MYADITTDARSHSPFARCSLTNDWRKTSLGTRRDKILAERGGAIQVHALAAEVCLVNDIDGQVAAGAGPKSNGTGEICII